MSIQFFFRKKGFPQNKFVRTFNSNCFLVQFLFFKNLKKLMSSEEVDFVKENLNLLGSNSPIWAFGKLFKKISNNDMKEFKLEEILNLEQLERRRFMYTDSFKEENGEFLMKCRICNFETKYHLSSKSCSPFLDHIYKSHSSFF